MKYTDFLKYKRISESIKNSDLKFQLSELQDLCSNSSDCKMEYHLSNDILDVYISFFEEEYNQVNDVEYSSDVTCFSVNLTTLIGYISSNSNILGNNINSPKIAIKYNSIDEFFSKIEFHIQEELNISESIIKFSDKFKKILSNIDSDIAKDLLILDNTDITTSSNYVDIVDNSTVSFLPDSKVKTIIDNLSKNNNYFKINRDNNYLVPKDGIKHYWDKLGIVFPGEEDVRNASVGEVVELLSTTPSIKNPDKIYAAIKRRDGYTLIVNLDSLTKVDVNLDIDLFKSAGRNNIKIGRITRALLKSGDKTFTDKDLEDFVNKYKTQCDIESDVFKNIKIVSGDDIRINYNESNYASGGGTLNNSCMRYNNCSNYFGIYVNNPDKVSMCCLYNDDGKLIARALVWKLDSGKTFMDRIYSINDYQVDLLRQYAIKNNWYYKSRNNSSADENVMSPDGTSISDMIMKVTIIYMDYDKYPYVDTLKYYSDSYNNTYLTNDTNSGLTELEETDGGNSRRCSSCEGSGREGCYECGGDGSIECYECNGTGEVDCDTCDSDGTKPCDTCDGEGNIDDEECTDCKGEGTIECEDCKGRGKLDCDNCDGNGSNECRECGGDGSVDCSECS